MNKPRRIFLCHASEDKPKVVEVYRFLKQQGFDPWLDQEDLLPGQRWDQEIPKAIRASDFILIFFSQNSVLKRGYVQKEFKLALEVLDEIPEEQIFVIPVRLDDSAIPEQFHLLHYCDLFEDDGFDKVVRAIRTSLGGGNQALTMTRVASTGSALPPAAPLRISLRSEPTAGFSFEAANAMLKEKDFFDSSWYKKGHGLQHQYEVVERNDGKLVIDHTTGLMWQHSGSPRGMHYAKTAKYISDLNNEKFAGYDDWRLPTLEEAMSLVEPEKKSNDLYIDPIFGPKQSWIWTADKNAWGAAWSVGFNGGGCNYYFVDDVDSYVRAVRSEQ